jgi:hypothetical protein
MRTFPRDLTPQERHRARLEAREYFERGDCRSDRIYVAVPETKLEVWALPPSSLAELRVQQTELRVLRAVCEVHPKMLLLLFADEQVEGSPCPLCWAAAAIEC